MNHLHTLNHFESAAKALEAHLEVEKIQRERFKLKQELREFNYNFLEEIETIVDEEPSLRDDSMSPEE